MTVPELYCILVVLAVLLRIITTIFTAVSLVLILYFFTIIKTVNIS